MVKNPPAKAGEMGSIPGSGRSLEEEMATHSSILALEMPGTEEPGGLQSMGSQSQTRLKFLSTPQTPSNYGSKCGLFMWGPLQVKQMGTLWL